MKKKFSGWSVLMLFVLPLVFSLAAVAQQSTPRPYHSGPVWDISYIKVKAGMEDRYMRYLAQDWKREQEAMKKAGFVMDYKAISTEPHGAQDFNVILMVQYKDLATMEANEEKMEDLGEKLFGGMPTIEAGYKDRSAYRDIIGNRLGREVILEPKGK